jgi:hypothetical protein
MYTRLAVKGVSESLLKKETHYQLKLTYCGWMNGNKKPSIRGKSVSFY